MCFYCIFRSGENENNAPGSSRNEGDKGDGENPSTKSANRASGEQLRYYVDFLREHPELQAGKHSPKQPAMLKTLWDQLADGLNARRGPVRSCKKWKEVSLIKISLKSKKI